MTDIQTHRAAVCARSGGDEYIEALKKHMPALHRLFEILDAGATPNFLDIMAGISEMVAFYTECDQFDAASKLLEEKMSGKFCRFCS